MKWPCQPTFIQHMLIKQLVHLYRLNQGKTNTVGQVGVVCCKYLSVTIICRYSAILV